MGRGINKLSDRAVREQKQPGYYGDGGGLWLQVSKTGTKSWVFRYTRQGKTHDLGLGSYLNVGLKMARDKAADLRATLGRGDDPKAERWAAKANAASRMTFDQCAEKYIAAHKDGWKNPKHADQWEATLKTYASPIIGSLDVAHIDTPHIVRILEPIWATKNETASRVRGRIERILAWATTRKLRKGDNPAAWRNHLDTLLPKPSAVQKEKHHEALPYRAVNAFMQELREQPGVAPRALEFTILTAARTGEVIGAHWDEIDLGDKVWTVPAERMKAKKEHRIPLPPRAVEILKEMQADSDGCQFVFPGWSGDKGLSNMAMLKLLKGMGHTGLTVHGFRSTFRDWAGEQTPHAREVIEHALAHQLKDKAEAAYQRGTLFDKRRALMNDWATYIETEQPAAQTAIAA
ncbi:integrase arm-type DNA-binding domain-containing protein [Ralstonia pseudosolanacearum]|uniref:tyrosine-type recombinase/integrase n=1 Tax=Ralstonia pseudosolanacearum TaxID=1310165 RepID=UPI0026F76B4F|nr:integrase arm-type DNA-binding domain-containing protein [Ralstonia pseudosolanacearum]MDO3618799.1 integrase arm-type DNA-binding domain-containing protein [Ralstonia pseudosolanacearum]